MPIQRLSEPTSRVIASTQILNNATSVIKELLDNALDARASSISIEIAANTLDKIVVKDDGSGIGVQDRQLLCKRGCTSKIQNLDDLANLGGTSLGFRGTALASIAELSERVTIVTKVDGEQPATTMTFGADGRLQSSASASHNDGTTVKVENFLASVPVRRKFVSKNPFKVVDEIKKLLQSYAFARPSVKLSFKVLKAKNDKANWSFAACKDGGQLLAAACQIVGKQIAGHCRLHTITLADIAGTHHKYSIEALLLNTRDTDLSKAGSVGQYASVDSRPVNCEKGVMKEIGKLYKKHLQQSSAPEAHIPSKPFLVIYLKCPDRSYDVNVETAKDEILFHEQGEVLDLTKKLFGQCYGQLNDLDQKSKDGTPKQTQKFNPSSFDILLSRTRPEIEREDSSSVLHEDERSRTQTSNPADTSEANRSLVESFAESLQSDVQPNDQDYGDISATTTVRAENIPKTHHNMQRSIHDFDDRDTSSPRANDCEEEEVYNPDDATLNNPFTRAKIHSLRRTDLTNNRDEQSQDRRPDSQSEASTTKSPWIRKTGSTPRVSMNNAHSLPSPQTSPFASDKLPYQNPGPPFPRRNKRAYDGDDYEDEDGDYPSPLQRPRGSRQSDLAEWVRSPGSDSLLSFQSAAELNVSAQSVASRLVPLRSTTNELSSSGIAKQPQRSTHKPFRSPLKQPRDTTTECGPLGNASAPFQTIQPTALVESIQPSRQTNEDLEYILEFEQQKKLVNQRRKLNQATLNPADLARIQKSSGIAADFILSQPLQEGQNDSNERVDADSVSQTDIALRFGQAAKASQPQSVTPNKSNPHHNRYLAAVRRLQPQGSQSSPSHIPSKADTRNETGHLPPESAILGQRVELDEPSHGPNQEPSSPRSKRSIKRVKSSRLPFESIPPSATANHATLATPAVSFPSSSNLSTTISTLTKYDSYLKTGKNEFSEWSLSGVALKEVEHWHKTLDDLVKTGYRLELATDTEGGNGGSESASASAII